MHLSQAGLSRRLKVNQSTVSRVESHRKRMTHNLLYKLRERISVADFEELKEVFDEWEKQYWCKCRPTPCKEGEYREAARPRNDKRSGMPEAQGPKVH